MVCECEHNGQSPFGKVQDSEVVVRILISPLHIDPGEILPKPTAFGLEDLASRGLSLFRLVHTTEDNISTEAEALRKGRADRQVAGMLCANAGAVRHEIIDEQGRQAFCIVDDAQPNQPMHAYLIRSADQKDPEIRRLRGKLMKIFGELLTIGH